MMISVSPNSSSVGRYFFIFSGGTRLGSISGNPLASRRANSRYASLCVQDTILEDKNTNIIVDDSNYMYSAELCSSS